jgi:hypothetical protein
MISTTIGNDAGLVQLMTPGMGGMNERWTDVWEVNKVPFLFFLMPGN